jgi:hypothetical protein
MWGNVFEHAVSERRGDGISRNTICASHSELQVTFLSQRLHNFQADGQQMCCQSAQAEEE